MLRRNGISVLLASQDEEVTVGWSILSFIPLADEIIVVDNGSEDASVKIGNSLADAFPGQVAFYSRPGISTLEANRAFALSKSKYRWIVRGDADYICGSEAHLRTIRNRLLKRGRLGRPLVVSVPQPNVAGDFWHTWMPRTSDLDYEKFNRTAWTEPMSRIYEYVYGFRFARVGRWERGVYPALLRRLVSVWALQEELWWHCDVKSALNMLFRTERTNWRQEGDFVRWPDLDVYVREVIRQRYQTGNIAEAADTVMNRYVLPKLSPLDDPPNVRSSPPRLLCAAREALPVYKVTSGGRRRRVNSSQEIADFWEGGFWQQYWTE